MTDAKALIRGARLREATYRVCLRGDLVGEHAALDAELTALTAVPLTDPDAVTDLAARIQALEAEMADATLTLRFRALKRHEWADLIDAHPGRKPDERFDFSTFVPALLAACLVDPVLDGDDIDALLDAVNEAQRDEMFGVAWAVNNEDASVPFSVRASVVTRARERSSKQPEPGESPEASS
jgi:hypothetical protein